jgi:hypothetical protein
VKPGGIYIVEDWAWNHWSGYQAPDHGWGDKVSPSELAFELAEATGSLRAGIEHVEVYPGFLAIERSNTKLDGSFSLDAAITRRASPVYDWFKR